MPFRTIIALAIAALTLAVALPAHAGTAAPPQPTGTTTAAAPQERLNLNTATKEALVAVPGIGPRTAQAIVDLRARKGGYQRIEELLEVRGIGEKNLKELAKYLAVPAPAPTAAAVAR